MSDYADLERRLAARDVIVLDGAVEATPVTPDEFIAWAKARVADGVQIVGGCCGIEIEHIRPLRDALPTHLP